ncbi:NADH dehydrogenase [ubiquinone] 1 beta subcomplex subunit 4-like isoform X1 [Saccoglossus kowalevskii]|uniref:NADH dehydrogenase [ubiquinone] 1 beta subcomplex subunit 4 n=1 Tax=Saccoglossus kowalevskii TaxID=10224 RepID=A0ABM0GRB2_SACKO|nr:PREDICTED: uncharacterized protein LOC100370512 [Saccoglossus kowalevskii]
MADYTGIPSDVKRAEFERAEIRNQLRREFQRQRQNPHITGRIEEPAVQRWAMARAQGYSYFKATPKTSILGFLVIVVPPVSLFALFHYDRKRREEMYDKGVQQRPYNLLSA